MFTLTHLPINLFNTCITFIKLLYDCFTNGSKAYAINKVVSAIKKGKTVIILNATLTDEELQEIIKETNKE